MNKTPDSMRRESVTTDGKLMPRSNPSSATPAVAQSTSCTVQLIEAASGRRMCTAIVIASTSGGAKSQLEPSPLGGLRAWRRVLGDHKPGALAVHVPPGTDCLHERFAHAQTDEARHAVSRL